MEKSAVVLNQTRYIVQVVGMERDSIDITFRYTICKSNIVCKACTVEFFFPSILHHYNNRCDRNAIVNSDIMKYDEEEMFAQLAEVSASMFNRHINSSKGYKNVLGAIYTDIGRVVDHHYRGLALQVFDNMLRSLNGWKWLASHIDHSIVLSIHSQDYDTKIVSGKLWIICSNGNIDGGIFHHDRSTGDSKICLLQSLRRGLNILGEWLLVDDPSRLKILETLSEKFQEAENQLMTLCFPG